MSAAKQPTAIQVEELKRYAAEHGRLWKSALLDDWTNGRTVGLLQEVRNQLGPSWLLRHGSDAIKPASLAEGIAAKRSEIVASGFCQWEYRPVKECPDCGSALELVKAEDGGMIEEPYLPKWPLRDQPLPRRSRPASFLACTGCEYHEEVHVWEVKALAPGAVLQAFDAFGKKVQS